MAIDYFGGSNPHRMEETLTTEINIEFSKGDESMKNRKHNLKLGRNWVAVVACILLGLSGVVRLQP
jgi:hypothetical protein